MLSRACLRLVRLLLRASAADILPPTSCSRAADWRPNTSCLCMHVYYVELLPSLCDIQYIRQKLNKTPPNPPETKATNKALLLRSFGDASCNQGANVAMAKNLCLRLDSVALWQKSKLLTNSSIILPSSQNMDCAAFVDSKLQMYMSDCTPSWNLTGQNMSSHSTLFFSVMQIQISYILLVK